MVRKRIEELEEGAKSLEQKIKRRPKEPGVVTDISPWEGASDSQYRHPSLLKIPTISLGFAKALSFVGTQFGFGFLKLPMFLPHQFSFGFFKGPVFTPHPYAFGFFKGLVFRCGRLSFQFESLQFLVTLSSRVKYNPDKEILGLSDEIQTNLNP